jgi:Ran GTPase-activating protein (RanGAP) involved in mRNA processing and transport
VRAPHLASLQRLEITGAVVGGDGAALLGAALQAATQLSRLQCLALKACMLGPTGAAHLAAALQASPHLSSLQKLDLRWSQLMPHGGARLAEALQAATHLSRLHTLKLEQCRLYGGAAQRLAEALRAPHLAASLTHLDLRRNRLGGGGAQALARTLAGPGLPRLRHLSLASCKIGPDAGLKLGAALCASTSLRQLRELYASGNSADAQRCIAEAVGANPALAHLSKLVVSPPLLDEVLPHLRAAPHLRCLTVNGRVYGI